MADHGSYSKSKNTSTAWSADDISASQQLTEVMSVPNEVLWKDFRHYVHINIDYVRLYILKYRQ